MSGLQKMASGLEVAVAFLGSIFPALLAELFPTGIRASGIAVLGAVAMYVSPETRGIQLSSTSEPRPRIEA